MNEGKKRKKKKKNLLGPKFSEIEFLFLYLFYYLFSATDWAKREKNGEKKLRRAKSHPHLVLIDFFLKEKAEKKSFGTSMRL